MAYLAAVSSSTMPIFIRTKGDVPPLSFPMVGSIHGVQIFASKMEGTLLSCCTSGAKVVWKQYCDSISLILVTSDTSTNDIHCNHMLDLIFNAMVLLVGLHELENLSSVERLKKDLKCCYPLIDYIFREEHTLMSPLTMSVDVMVLEDTSTVLKTLEAFTEVAKSSFGCLSIHGRICVATDKWWELSPFETSLLSLFLCCLPPATCWDIPVYLPKASNKVAHRLVIFTLFEGIHLSVICNPSPPLTELQEQLPQYWLPLATQLKNSAHIFPRCIHLSVSFESSILAFTLVNLVTRRTLTSLKPSVAGDYQKTDLTAGYHGEMKLEKRYTYLSRFYKMVSGDIFPSPNSEGSGRDPQKVIPSLLSSRAPHSVLETYTCAKRYKAYAMNRDNNYNLYALFTSTTPTFALQKLTAHLYETLVHNRTITII